MILLVALAILLAGSGALMAWRIQRTKGAISESHPIQRNVPAAPQKSAQNLIPPAPPLKEGLALDSSPDENPADQHLSSPTFSYDPAQTFAANIERFRIFCDTDTGPERLKVAKDFVAQLLEQAKANGFAPKTPC